MIRDDPWKDLVLPGTPESISARRVDADIPWNFFWALSFDHRYLLVLRHDALAAPKTKLPRLKGIEVTEHHRDNDSSGMLALKLLDSAQREIFRRLCQDIVESASTAKSEQEAVQITLARMWRWHHLLRGGTNGGLTEAEQAGLIGEMIVMERLLIPVVGAVDTVLAWRGPLDAPKDFEVGLIGIEAKAHRGAATPFVLINSEHQLDDSGLDSLFLYVVELTRAPSGSGSSVSDVALRLRNRISGEEPAALEMYEQLLEAAGFRWSDDYSDTRWLEGSGRLFRVSEGFPRISATEITNGVMNVRYSIAFSECERFIVPEEDLTAALMRAQDANRA